MLAWLNNPEEAPPPVTVRRGRSIRLKWEHSHARIDDRYYLSRRSRPVRSRSRSMMTV